MAAIPEIDVVAACDIVAAARDRFTEQWSGRWPGLRVYSNYQELLERERPDIVSVVIPDHLHTAPVLAAIEFAEKQGLLLNKLAGPTNETRQGLSVAEAEAIASEDEDLIYLDVPDDAYYGSPPSDFQPER